MFDLRRLFLTHVSLIVAITALLAPSARAQQQAVNADLRAASGNTPSTLLQTDTDFFWYQLNFQNRQTNKEIALLENHDAWLNQGDEGLVLLVGGQARLSALAAHTNTLGKFPYQGRFPADFTGNTATDARLLQANVAMAAHASSWVNAYGELLFSDVFTFPDFKQGSLQMRQAYAVFGDLDATPWYAFVGKKNLTFGDMGTLSPFSQSMVWHYFGALGEGIGGGYDGDVLQATITGVNGGRGIRVADSERKGKIDNLAANALFRFELGDDVQFRFGGGYLLGTSYDGAVPEHLNPNLTGRRNPAWDVNALLRWGRLTLAGEFATTVKSWPASGHKVEAYRAEAGYDVNVGRYPGRLSVSWSEGIQGARGTPFEFNRQLVIGLGTTLNRYAMFSLEYVRSTGFAPLIDLTTVSDRNTVQDTALAGLTLVF